MATVLVTGGAGFIGSHLVRALLARGDQVRVLDDFSTGHRRNLESVQRDIELIEGTLLNLDTVSRAVHRADVVYHQGALPSVPRSVKDPLGSHHVNATGTLHVLLAARDAGVRRVVFAGSSSAYGNVEGGAKDETLPVQPLSPYALQKVYGEFLCRQFFELFGLETVVLRYFNVFGPRQDPHSPYSAVIPLFITWLSRGQPVRIYGDGEQRRDFTYIDNVISANLLAAHAEGAAGTLCNVGAGVSTSVNTLARMIAEIMGRPLDVQYMPARPGDVRDSLADLRRARSTLGYEPVADLRTGLEKTVAWFCDATLA